MGNSVDTIIAVKKRVTDPAGNELMRGLTALSRVVLVEGRVGGVYSVLYFGALSRLILEYLGGGSLLRCSSVINIHSSSPISSSSVLEREEDGFAGKLANTPSVLRGVIGVVGERYRLLSYELFAAVKRPLRKPPYGEGPSLSERPLGANGSSSFASKPSSTSSSTSLGGLYVGSEWIPLHDIAALRDDGGTKELDDNSEY